MDMTSQELEVQVQDGHIITTSGIASIVTADEEESIAPPNYNYNLQEGSQGQSCSEFYRLSGITLRKQELLNRIRDGDYSALAKLGPVVIPTPRYDISHLVRTGFLSAKREEKIT